MKIVGHRGARGLAPENTLASLRKALEHGVDEIEFDVRVTKDDVPILHHDADLTDPDQQKRLIAGYSFVELKKHKQDLTTLAEALDLLNPKTSFYIEVKADVDVQPIIKLLKARLAAGLDQAAIKLGSFSQKTLLDLHKSLPNITKIVIENWSSVRARRRADELGTKYISLNQRWLWSGFIKAVSRSGWKLYAFTLNDPAKAAHWQKHGLYGAVTDYPDRF